MIFLGIKHSVGLRASRAEEEEVAGLDVSEHGMHAYPAIVPVPNPRASGAHLSPCATSTASEPL